jgi:hypothetical protein
MICQLIVRLLVHCTDCGMDGPGIESLWKRDFLHTSTPALGRTEAPLHMVPGLSRGIAAGARC